MIYFLGLIGMMLWRSAVKVEMGRAMRLPFILPFSILYSLTNDLPAQVISGTAPGFEGCWISIVVYDDLISEKETALVTCKVDGMGHFALKADVKEAQYAFLRSGRECADLIIEPGKDYTVRFARPTRAAAEETFAARFTQKSEILGGSGKSLNDEMRRFNAVLDRFLEEQYKHLMMRKGTKAVGEATKVFKAQVARDLGIPGGYLGAHIRYSLAQAELVAQVRRDTLHARYLKGQWLPQSFEYVRFLGDFHGGVLKQRAKADPKAMQHLVSAPDALIQLDGLLAKDPLLTDERQRGFVIVSGLRDLFAFKELDPNRLAELLHRFADTSKDPYLARAARNVAQMNTRLLRGAVAPALILPTAKGSTLDLNEMKGRTVVLEFTDPENPLCMEESIAFANLYRTYGSKAEFVTVCIAKAEVAVKGYVSRISPLWSVCRTSNESDVVLNYALAGVPTYFIIGPTGKLINSPARTPSRGLEEDIIRAVKK